MSVPIQLTIRGVRGSCATPFPDRLEYGGNTSCISMQAGSSWIICDAGTGILSAAEELRYADPAAVSAVHIFISHLHLDHISALPMFLAALPKGLPVQIWGMSSDGFMHDGSFRLFSETLQHVLCPPLWPVSLRELCPQLVFHDLTAGEKQRFADRMAVTAFPAGHPDGTANYRFELDGRTVWYGLDCEIRPDDLPAYAEAARNADLILFDGTYTAEDYERCRGFGHTPMSLAPVVLRETAARRLLLMHYNNSYTDAFLQEQEELLCTGHPGICFAREGMTVTL